MRGLQLVLIRHMKPRETVLAALKRLGAKDKDAAPKKPVVRGRKTREEKEKEIEEREKKAQERESKGKRSRSRSRSSSRSPPRKQAKTTHTSSASSTTPTSTTPSGQKKELTENQKAFNEVTEAADTLMSMGMYGECHIHSSSKNALLTCAYTNARFEADVCSFCAQHWCAGVRPTIPTTT